MKVVFPVGRGISRLETEANLGGAMPLGCICSSGNASLSVGYNCASCACQCEYGDQNRSSNFGVAQTQRNYVNI